MNGEKMVWNRRHLLGIEGLARDEVEQVFSVADSMREINQRDIKKVPSLRGKTVINLFYENSTRTRTSFELAGKRMSADVINISPSSSSTKKGETLLDTVANLDAMNPDVVVIRHHESGAQYMLSRWLGRGAVVNAGDGRHEHPTQALLDCFTIRDHLETGELGGKSSFTDLTVAICGDVLHSRVARSNALLLGLLGAKVRFVGPPTLMPSQAEKAFGVEVVHDMDAGLEGADVVMVLRLQMERMNGNHLPGVREYFEFWGLSRKRLARALPHAMVMHPGPMNRGVEIASDVADDRERSVILDQVANGLALRMGILYLLCGGGQRKV
ncbi:MAG: aspartate carbamoyltransferase catalytic subunit [Magnetococcus sp. WYHC-3]